MARRDWVQIGVGAIIVVVSLLDPVPADELFGVPAGSLLIIKGFGWI